MVKRVTSVLTICLVTILMMGTAKLQSFDQSVTEEVGESVVENVVNIDDQIKQLKSTIVANPRVLVTSAEENEEPIVDVENVESVEETSEE